MSLLQFFRILQARLSIVMTAVLVCLASAIAVGFIIPARYEAKTRVMLNVVKPDPVTGDLIASQFVRTFVQTQTELIKDYRIAGKVVDELGWEASPELADAYAKRSSSDHRDFRRWIAQQIIDNTNAQLVEGSNILEISYVAPEPKLAASVADTIRRAYVEQTLALKRDDAIDSAEWFRKQADQLKVELAAAEQRKTEFERTNHIVLGDDNVDEDARRLTALSNTGLAAGAAPVTLGGGSNPMAGQLAQADAAIAAAQRTLGPNNPDLVNMRRQRDAIAAAAAASVQRPVVSGGGGPSLAATFNAQVNKVLAQRGKVDEARKLAASVTVLRDQYNKALAKSADFDQQSQTADSGLTILGSATEPQSAKWPRWPLIIIGSIGLGLGIGVLAALLTELLRRRVRGPEDLKLGSVPMIGMMAPPTVNHRGLFGFSRRREIHG